ncbi:hypothetical protein LSH36_62g01064 [Paralvinella palmiformis]|uniref:Reverse transcriptase domain-containing protein n=1 Tax=Paralvinella palmiformis TaxID=53620 RepID=A0AAD9K3Z7_9ANNE|nr:hypothetical protein LSH36_62g01064 [Paralvinella palmiformis]
MDNILAGLENVTCFFDNILVTGNTKRDHLKTLKEVLLRLDKHSVRFNKTKCQFLKSEETYPGHTVSTNGIQLSRTRYEPSLRHRLQLT